MAISRRALLRGLGPAVALPSLLRSSPADADITIRQVGIPIVLGAGQPGGKRGVTLSAFNNGGYLAGWVNTPSPIIDPRAFIQKFSRTGAELSAPIQLGGGPLTDGIPAFSIAAVTFPNDTSLVFFSAAPNASPTDFDIFCQRMSANFTKIGNPTRVNTMLTGAQLGILATPLGDGNVQVVWESAATNFLTSTIPGRIVQPNGVALTPERTLISNPQGSNTPRSLTFWPTEDDVILAYSEVFNNGMQTLSTDVLQRIRANVLFGTPRRLPSAPVNRQFGSFGLVRYDPRDGDRGPRDDVGYFVDPPGMGDVGGLKQYEINFGGTPATMPVANMRVDPAWGGSPQVVPIDINNIRHLCTFVRTESSSANSMQAMVIRRSNGMPVAQRTAVFSGAYLDISTAARLRLPPASSPEVVVGCSFGDNATNEVANVRRFQVVNLP